MQRLRSLAQGIGRALDTSLLDLLAGLHGARQLVIELGSVTLDMLAHVSDNSAHLVKLIT